MAAPKESNHAAWIGPLLAFLGLVSYFAIAARIPSLRDSALPNVALVATGVAVALWGLVRRRSWKSWLGLVGAGLPAALLLGYVYVLSNQLPASADSAPRVGQPAPRLELPDHTGRQVSLEAYAGRRVVVVFYRGFW